MEKGINHVQWCMDACRWDTFVMADIPNMASIQDFRMVYARAGMTPSSLFATWANVPWYESGGEQPVPWMDEWVWLPRDLRFEGYYTAFISCNPVMRHYRWKFNDFDEYIDLGKTDYYADQMVEHVRRIYEEVDKPKYIFLLLMETHGPYPYKKGLSLEYMLRKYQNAMTQVMALENIDKDFGKMRDYLIGTNTDILVFSDHGTLDLYLEGAQGHMDTKYHNKLFEIPLGRRTV